MTDNETKYIYRKIQFSLKVSEQVPSYIFKKENNF